MDNDKTERKPVTPPLIIPADPLGAGLTVIDLEKKLDDQDDNQDDTLRGPLGETTRKPYENEG